MLGPNEGYNNTLNFSSLAERLTGPETISAYGIQLFFLSLVVYNRGGRGCLKHPIQKETEIYDIFDVRDVRNLTVLKVRNRNSTFKNKLYSETSICLTLM
jgi:hypothetical protein